VLSPDDRRTLSEKLTEIKNAFVTESGREEVRKIEDVLRGQNPKFN